MRFTILAVLPGLLLTWLDVALRMPGERYGPVALLAGLALWAALLVVPVYWGARIVRRAWRDGARQP